MKTGAGDAMGALDPGVDRDQRAGAAGTGPRGPWGTVPSDPVRAMV
jgi:hypothetical protein